MRKPQTRSPIAEARSPIRVRLTRIIGLVAGTAAIILALASPLAAKSWRITDFQDTITVNPDGSAVITEHLTLTFVGEWHGIHRIVPIEYPGPNHTNYELFIDVTSVTDGVGGKLKYDTSASGGNRDLKILIPDAAAVTFPGATASSLQAQAFTGVYGSTEHSATATVDGAIATFETTSRLPMRGGMTIDVYIPKGILHQPSALTRLFWFIGGNPTVFFPLVTLVVMFSLWWFKGRDPDPGMSVAPMYEPPKGVSPA